MEGVCDEERESCFFGYDGMAYHRPFLVIQLVIQMVRESVEKTFQVNENGVNYDVKGGGNVNENLEKI